MINFTCPKCSEPLEAPESMLGSILDCPQCKTRLLVPGGPGMIAHIAPDPDTPKLNSKPLPPHENSVFGIILIVIGTILLLLSLLQADDYGYMSGLSAKEAEKAAGTMARFGIFMIISGWLGMMLKQCAGYLKNLHRLLQNKKS